MLSIKRLTALPPQLAELEREASAQGFNFVGRLIDEWHSGVNTFDKPGECLLGVISRGALVGIGGLNVDPYVTDGFTARLRRLYVVSAFRRRGIGEALVLELLQNASLHFRQVRLLTDTESAAAFYSRLGFMPVEDEAASHVKTL